MNIIELEMSTGHLALKVETSILVCVLRVLLALQVAIIEHVDTNEVCHLVVHHLALAKLECQILIILIFLRCL